jgi:hypothetical protein
MPTSKEYRPHHPLRETMVKGILIGTSGGVAELALLWVLLRARGDEPAAVAVALAEASHLGSSAATGIAICMALSLLLGVALMGAWRSLGSPLSNTPAVALFMAAAAIVVWSFGFLVLLPSIEPAMAALLPYPVTLAAKLAYALAAAPVLHRLDSTRTAVFVRPPMATKIGA